MTPIGNKKPLQLNARVLCFYDEIPAFAGMTTSLISKNGAI